MARYSYHQKVHLVVDFLVGMRLPETYAALADSGWSAEKLERGWRLLEQAGRARFSEELITADRTDEALDAFKKRWFSVVRIVLGKKSPRLAARLVGELEVRSQAIASFLVEPFLKVLRQFEASSDPSEREARELLRERGLTDEVVREATTLVERARKAIVTRPADSFLEAETRAEEELWEFYLEWSSLARRAIANRLLLRRLGLNKAGRTPRTAEGAEAPVRVTQLQGQAAPAPSLPRLPAPSEGAPEKSETSEKKNNEPATLVRTVRDTSQLVQIGTKGPIDP